MPTYVVTVHHQSIQHGRFITWTVHHTVNSTPVDSSQKLLYSAVGLIVFNISFSKVCDYYQENAYLTLIKKMSKLVYKKTVLSQR